jgi:hypothetical protein
MEVNDQLHAPVRTGEEGEKISYPFWDSNPRPSNPMPIQYIDYATRLRPKSQVSYSTKQPSSIRTLFCAMGSSYCLQFYLVAHRRHSLSYFYIVSSFFGLGSNVTEDTVCPNIMGNDTRLPGLNIKCLLLFSDFQQTWTFFHSKSPT